LDITPEDVNLTLQNYPGEEAWLTGSLELDDLQWEEYDVSLGKDVRLENTNNAKGCSFGDFDSETCGCKSMASADECQAACDEESCTSWTYHDAALVGKWSTKCCLHRDNVWNPMAEANHTSGHRTTQRMFGLRICLLTICLRSQSCVLMASA